MQFERRRPRNHGVWSRREENSEIDHSIIDKLSGPMAYTGMSFGGFNGSSS